MKFKDDRLMSDEDLIDISNTMFVTLLITKLCNIKCWYCDVLTGNSKKSRFMNLLDLDMIIHFIDIQDQPKKPNICINFFGGEPTLNPHLSNMVYKIKEYFEGKRNVDILITTNLIKPLEYFKSLPKELIYAASFHSDWVKDPDEWFKKARYLNDNKQLYHAVLMMQMNNMGLIYYQMHKNYDIPSIICPIDQIINDIKYMEYKDAYDNWDMFEDSEKELFYGDRNKSDKFHMCSSGIIIDEYGDVYKCWPTINKPVTNVFENPDKTIPIWHPCNNYTSNCDMEVIRSSIRYYLDNIKNKMIGPEGKEYTLKELKKYKNRSILFRCNA